MTDKIQQARRKLFEALYAKNQGISKKAYPVWFGRHGDTYESPAVAQAWWGFNTALDSISLDLKSPYMDYSYTDSEITGACKQYDRCRASIESTGLGIKVND